MFIYTPALLQNFTGKLGVYVCHHGFSLGGNPVYNNGLSGYGEGFDF